MTKQFYAICSICKKIIKKWNKFNSEYEWETKSLEIGTTTDEHECEKK